ncbi:MAG: BamA/TamA family outer membrane protein, partial [Bacteroidetes bacterium]|nr:BamA/TamA family outer membrane protein [Bacteroidota bacterium]
MKNKVGEAPTIFEEKLCKKSAENFRLSMFNKGYLQAKVSYQSVFKGKKVTLKYSIDPGELYHINKIYTPEASNTLLTHLEQANKESLLKEGNAFDIDVLDEERKRISNFLRNVGYFNFRKDYVIFEIDSNNAQAAVDIYLKIENPSSDLPHRKYTINEVYVYTDYNLASSDSSKMDTIQFKNYHFLSKQHKFKPKVLASAIFFEKGQYFRLEDYQKTLRKLANYGTFKFVDIQFETVYIENKPHLNTFIYITPAKKQTIAVDLQANHNFIGLTGSSLSFTYQNKNLSKIADLLELKLSSGVEFNVGKGYTTPLNNADVLVEANYYLNKFLVPFPLKNVSKNNNVKTKFSVQYNFERRIQFYSLHSTSFSFGYEWNETSNKRHLYNPIATNLLLIPKKEQDFIDRINEIPSLRRSFDEQMILGSNYTFLYNNKKSESDRSYFLFQGKVAFAGNLIHGIVALTKQARNNSVPYNILNREYSMFARFEGNIVHNFQLGKHSTINTRFNAGLIIPYGNSSVAPYFQQFYVGGSNSIRAFRIRALGPGTYADTANIDNPNFFYDQAGDFKLEANAELRFDIYKWFKGAMFVDAGNVWLLRKDDAREGGEIAKGNFINAIALGAGFGLRLDFDYFVIRTDFSLPLVDPRFSDDRKYPLKSFEFG